MKFLPLSVVASLGLVAAACGSNSDERSTKLELATFSYDTIAYDHSADSVELPGSQYLRCKGNGVLPVSIADIAVPELRDSLMALAGMSYNAATPVPVLDSVYSLVGAREIPDSLRFSSYSANSLSVYLVTPSVIVWENYASSYIGGAAHGSYATTYVNYAINEHKIIRLSDLFKKDYEKPLLQMIKEKLADNPDLLSFADIEIPDDFCISTDGLTFIWGIYEIAPYAAGEIRVSFYPYELNDLLTPFGMTLLQSE